MVFKICISFILVFTFFEPVFAQDTTKIKGNVVEEGTAIGVEGVSILLKDKDEKLVSYAISDAQGNFVINFKAEAPLTVEFSHLTYVSKKVPIRSDQLVSDKPLKVILQKKDTNLEEVIVQGRSAAAYEKGDTLVYNIKAFTAGNEKKLKDIIRKLPGLEINASGQITSNGKVVDHLLIDGKPFFGKNHKLANDNLNAKMVDGVQFLKEVRDETTRDAEGGNETAINIKIKEEFKGKPTGDLEIFGAYDERYKLHANMFQFGKRYNLSFIGDVNNTGERALGILDYVLMDVDKDIKNADDNASSLNIKNSIPNFLFDTENAAAMNTKFGALNAVLIPNKTVAINAYSIVNLENMRLNRLDENMYFTGLGTINITEEITRRSKTLFSQNLLEVDYKPSANTILEYKMKYKPGDNETDSEVYAFADNKIQTVHEKEDATDFILGQKLGIRHLITKRKLIGLNVFSNIIKDTEFLNTGINGADSLMSVNQKTIYKRIESGVYANYTYRFNKNVLRSTIGYVQQKGSFFKDSVPDIGNDIIQNYVYTGLALERTAGFFQYKALVNLRAYQLDNVQKQNQFVVLPVLEAKLNFSSTQQLTASYSRQAGYANARQLNTFGYATDYRNFNKVSTVDYSRTLIKSKYGLQYTNMDMYSGTLILFNSIYSRTENYIENQSNVKGNFNYLQPFNTPSKLEWLNALRFDTRIEPLKTILKTKIEYSKFSYDTFFNGQPSSVNSEVYTLNGAFASYFNDALLNYELGFNYTLNKNYFGANSTQNKGIKMLPFLNLNGEINKKISYSIENSVPYFKGNGAETSFHQLNFRFDFNSSNSKFKYWVTGNNILNIDNPKIIEVLATNNRFSRSTIERLPGYIGLGVAFDF